MTSQIEIWRVERDGTVEAIPNPTNSLDTQLAYVVLGAAAPRSVFAWVGSLATTEAKQVAQRHAAHILESVPGIAASLLHMEGGESDAFKAALASLPEQEEDDLEETEEHLTSDIGLVNEVEPLHVSKSKRKKDKKKKKAAAGGNGEADASESRGPALVSDPAGNTPEGAGAQVSSPAGTPGDEEHAVPAATPASSAAPATLAVDDEGLLKKSSGLDVAMLSTPGKEIGGIAAPGKDTAVPPSPSADSLPKTPQSPPELAQDSPALLGASAIKSTDPSPAVPKSSGKVHQLPLRSPQAIAASTVPATAPKAAKDSGNAAVAAETTTIGAAVSLVPGEHTFVADELKGMKAESGIDMARKESYLSEPDFEKVFGKTRADFKAQPAWRQLAAKKQVGLW